MQHDAQHVVLMNIKNLRKELKVWGRYWSRQELGQGYASRSACDRLKEPFTPSRCGGSRNHLPPDHINSYDMKVYTLAIDCRRALRAQYICNGQWQLIGFDSKKTFLFWLRRAEMALFGE
ncbi:hypothetical protein [Shewanella benthica]|uniref:hypothetical protein n=1 Tax=Shewanella benthica TaxID=43661 RepID=UPI000DD303B8|nr:hypothetical protein [Shewanella benthica]